MAYSMSDLLQLVVSEGSSDLHIRVGAPPVIRVHGILHRVEGPSLAPEDTEELMRSITSEEHIQHVRERGGSDFGFAFGDMARFRVSVFKEKGNFGLVLRQIPNKLLTMEQIGIPPSAKEMLYKPRGLVLVTGPTGSGKTTTLASMINIINEERDEAHIITIEDPIEYYHKHKKSLINQREIGIDVPDFPEAIRRALRMDPDIILVGEMRDLATIQAAVTAAETGHIVFGTLHTNSAEGTVNRIIDVFPKEQQDQIRTQLSVAIIGVLAQGLLPRKPKGMVAAYEMLVVTPAISNLIRENKTYRINSSIQTGRKHGMILLDDSLFNLWRQGLVEEEEVIQKSHKPNDLKERIENAKKGIFDEEDQVEEE
jgi:twitching motility protein PilT